MQSFQRTGRWMALALPAVLFLTLTGCAEKAQRPMDSQPSRTEQPRQETTARAGYVTSSVALPTGDRDSSVLLLERSAPAQVQVGAPFDYTLKVTNTSDIPLHNVRVIGTEAGNFQVQSASLEGQTQNGEISYDLGTLRPGQSETITITGSAAQAGSIEDCFTATYTPLACLVVNVTQPALQLTKTMPTQVLQCEPIEVRYVVTNSGTGAARNVQIRDELPEGLVAANTGTRTIVAEVGTLAAGESKAFRAEVRAQRTGEFTNQATASADGNLSAEAQARVTVRKPQLEITKQAPQQVYIGRQLEYQITVRNTGDGEARNLVVTDQLPAGTSVIDAGEGTAAGGTVTWNLGTLAAGQSRTLNLTIDPGQRVAELQNVATATAFCAEDRVEARSTTRVSGIAAVLLEVIDATDPVRVGDSTTYVITVTNQGSALDEDIRVAFALEGFEFVDVAGPTGVASRGEQFELGTLPRLAPGEQATWRVQARAVESGDHRFKVQMQTARIGRPVIETEATRAYQFGEEEQIQE